MKHFLLGAGALALVLSFGVSSAQADDGKGEALFNLCTQCHGNAGEGKQDVAAPAIAGLPEWYVVRQLENFQSGARGTHFDDLEGMRMRPMSLSLYHEGDIQAVSAYVASLPLVTPERTLEGDADKGKNYYMLCASCHGIDGTGSEPQGGPPMIGQSDWYLYSALKKYQQGVRGRHSGDTFGLMMQPMALTLPNDEAIQDVVAHMMSLSPQ